MARPLWFPRAPPGPLSCVPLWGARAPLFYSSYPSTLSSSLIRCARPQAPPNTPPLLRPAPGALAGMLWELRAPCASARLRALFARGPPGGETTGASSPLLSGLASAALLSREGEPHQEGDEHPRAPRLIDWSSWPGGGCGVRFGLAPAGDNPGSELPPPPAHLLCRWAAELPSHRRGEARSSSEKIEGHRPLPHSSPPTLVRGWHRILFVGTHGELIRTRNLPFPKPRL